MNLSFYLGLILTLSVSNVYAAKPTTGGGGKPAPGPVTYRLNISTIVSSGNANPVGTADNALTVEKVDSTGKVRALAITSLASTTFTTSGSGLIPQITAAAPFYIKGRSAGTYNYTVSGTDQGQPYSFEAPITVTAGTISKLISPDENKIYNVAIGGTQLFTAKVTDFYDNQVNITDVAPFSFTVVSGVGTFGTKAATGGAATSTLTVPEPGTVKVTMTHSAIAGRIINATVNVAPCANGTHFENGSCQPDIKSCAIENGTGEQIWDPSTSSYGNCTVKTCNSGYEVDLASNSCVVAPLICPTGQHEENGSCQPDVKTCPITNGGGEQSWDSTSSTYSICTVKTCNTGYEVDLETNSCVEAPITCPAGQHEDNGVCVPDNKTCPIENGTGSQTYSEGVWGECLVNSCNSGYKIEENSCVIEPLICQAGEHEENGVCMSDIKSCAIENGAGEQTWNSGTLTYSACTVKTCNAGYEIDLETNSCVETPITCPAGSHEENGVCVSDIKTCSIENGSGSQTYSDGVWGECLVNSCNIDFHVDGNYCVSSKQSCYVENGTGEQTYTDGTWGSCDVISCNLSYHEELNSCVSDTRSCSDSKGTGVETYSSGQWGTCEMTSCNEGYYLENGECLINDVTPPSATIQLESSTTNDNSAAPNLIINATDDLSGVREMYYAIGTSPGDSDVTNGWPVISGSVTEFQGSVGNGYIPSGFALVEDQDYFISVQFVDNAGNWSQVYTTSAWRFSGASAVIGSKTFIRGAHSTSDPQFLMLYDGQSFVELPNTNDISTAPIKKGNKIFFFKKPSGQHARPFVLNLDTQVVYPVGYFPEITNLNGPYHLDTASYDYLAQTSDYVYFTANYYPTSTGIPQLWRYSFADDTMYKYEVPSSITGFNSSSSSLIDGLLYFICSNSTIGSEFCVFNPANGEFKIINLADDNPARRDSNASGYRKIGNYIYFQANRRIGTTDNCAILRYSTITSAVEIIGKHPSTTCYKYSNITHFNGKIYANFGSGLQTGIVEIGLTPGSQMVEIVPLTSYTTAPIIRGVVDNKIITSSTSLAVFDHTTGSYGTSIQTRAPDGSYENRLVTWSTWPSVFFRDGGLYAFCQREEYDASGVWTNSATAYPGICKANLTINQWELIHQIPYGDLGTILFGTQENPTYSD